MLMGGQFCLTSDFVEGQDIVEYAKAECKKKGKRGHLNTDHIKSDDEKSGKRDDDEGDGDEKDEKDDEEDEKRDESDEDDDEDEDDNRKWDDLQEGGFVKICGTLHVAEYGKNHWAITVNALEPGFYK